MRPTVSDASPGLGLLAERPLRMPTYLQSITDKFTELAGPLAESIGVFLRVSARPLPAEVARMQSFHGIEAVGSCYDGHFVNGIATMRFALLPSDLDTVVDIFFGGPLKEKMLRASIAQGFAAKVAETLLMELGAGFGPPTIVSAGEFKLHESPVLRVIYQINLGDRGLLRVPVEFARPYTDTLNAPVARVNDATCKEVAFRAAGIAAKIVMPLRDIDKWKPGSVVALPKADLDNVTIAAYAADRMIPLARGEMGTADEHRSIRIRELCDPDAAVVANSAAPEFGDETAAEAPSPAPPEEPAQSEPEIEIPMMSAFGD